MSSKQVIAALAAVVLMGAGCSLDEGAGAPHATRGQSVLVDEAITIETEHPYANHADETWQIVAPEEALQVIVYFDYFDTERGYDYVEIRNHAGQLVHRLSGNHDGESFTVQGNVARIRFQSDYSITRYGFSISHYGYEVDEPTRPTDHRPFCSAIGSRSEGWYWGDTLELIDYARCSDAPEPECGAIGSRSEGWYLPGEELIVWDICHQTVRISIEGEYCGPSIGFQCVAGLYCQGLSEGMRGSRGICQQNGSCQADEDCSAEGNMWRHPACMGYAVCNTEAGQCGWICGSTPLPPTWSWTTVLLRDVESAHPYANNTDESWEVHREGADRMRIHFARIDTEAGYDRLVVSGNREELALMYEGHEEDLWTPEMGGDTVTITLESDYSITDWGFRADMVSYYEPIPVGTCNRDDDCEHGQVCHPHYCFNPYEPCYGHCDRDTSCDDGEPISCRMMIPNCPDGTLLAHQHGCYACVDPETCAPDTGPGEGSPCSADGDCGADLRCKGILDGEGTCQDELWCAAETVAADCAAVIHPAVPGSWACQSSTCAWQAGMTSGTFTPAGLPMDIPDAEPAGIESRITVAGLTDCAVEASIDLTIRHSYRGDLVVALTDPSGERVVLHDRSGGGTDDLVFSDAPVTGGLGSAGANGDWVLEVSDRARLDTGTLDSWGLQLTCL